MRAGRRANSDQRARARGKFRATVTVRQLLGTMYCLREPALYHHDLRGEHFHVRRDLRSHRAPRSFSAGGRSRFDSRRNIRGLRRGSRRRSSAVAHGPARLPGRTGRQHERRRLRNGGRASLLGCRPGVACPGPATSGGRSGSRPSAAAARADPATAFGRSGPRSPAETRTADVTRRGQRDSNARMPGPNRFAPMASRS